MIVAAREADFVGAVLDDLAAADADDPAGGAARATPWRGWRARAAPADATPVLPGAPGGGVPHAGQSARRSRQARRHGLVLRRVESLGLVGVDEGWRTAEGVAAAAWRHPGSRSGAASTTEGRGRASDRSADRRAARRDGVRRADGRVVRRTAGAVRRASARRCSTGSCRSRAPRRVMSPSPRPTTRTCRPTRPRRCANTSPRISSNVPLRTMPNAGLALAPDWRPLDSNPADDTDAGRLKAFAIFLQQLMVELGAFEDQPTAACAARRAEPHRAAHGGGRPGPDHAHHAGRRLHRAGRAHPGRRRTEHVGADDAAVLARRSMATRAAI